MNTILLAIPELIGLYINYKLGGTYWCNVTDWRGWVVMAAFIAAWLAVSSFSAQAGYKAQMTARGNALMVLYDIFIVVPVTAALIIGAGYALRQIAAESPAELLPLLASQIPQALSIAFIAPAAGKAGRV